MDGLVYLAAAVEGVCYGGLDGGIAISLIVRLGLAFPVLALYAQEDVREKFIDKIINKGAITSFAVTEPHGGSDATKLETTVVRNGNYYILNGEKWCITNAPLADIIITFGGEVETKAPVAMILERNWEGIDVTPLAPIGLKSSSVGKISFKNVKVPVQNILGSVGDGLTVLNAGFTRERILVSFLASGIMERVLDDAFNYAHNRKVFGENIANYQFIKFRLTEMKLSLDTTKGLGHAALKGFVTNGDIMGMSSAAKMYSAQPSSFYCRARYQNIW